MKTTCKALKFLAAASVSALVPALAQADSYINYTTYEAPFNIGGVEAGNEIAFNGGQATYSVTNFSVQISGSYLNAGDNIEIKFYGVTGPASGPYAYTPGPELFDSGLISLTGLNTAGSILDLPNDGATGDLPTSGINIGGSTFIFTVQFSGPDAANGTVALFGPAPTDGVNYSSAWENNGGTWTLVTAPVGEQPYNFGAEADATPEPSSLALFGLGGLAALAFVAINNKRRAAAR